MAEFSNVQLLQTHVIFWRNGKRRRPEVGNKSRTLFSLLLRLLRNNVILCLNFIPSKLFTSMVTLTTGISFVILVKTALSYEMRWVILESVHGF